MKLEDIFKLPVRQEIIEKTIDNTIKKYLYTISNKNYDRTPVELLDNIYMGDFAKNLFFDFLKKKILNITTDLQIIDYDEIRTDNFQKADPGWDIKVINNNNKKILKIEVKSSMPPKIDVDNTMSIEEIFQNLINKRDVKIIASTNKGKSYILPNQLESEIHVQIYFFNASIYKKGFANFIELYHHIASNRQNLKKILNINKYNQPYYFGYSTKNEIENFRIENLSKNIKPTWTFSWTDALYWKSPIRKAHNFDTLLEFIKNEIS